MLAEQSWRYRLTELDQKIFDAVLPSEHPLLDALELIEWNSLTPLLEKYYVPDLGQPSLLPLFMLKLEFLRYQYNLSDRDVLERTETDMLFRWFLQIPVGFQLPVPSTLSKFRGRLGSQGFKEVFDQLVRLARQAGLVKDRLRLKDASHVIANIAVPTTLKLFSKLRDRLLEQLEIFDLDAANGYRIATELVREQTGKQDSEVRLTARVNLLQDIVHCISELPKPVDFTDNLAWQSLCKLKEIAEKVLHDKAHPKDGHRLLSLVDTEARRGKHGDWYDGYVLDVMMDADSELITQLQVLEAGGDEAKSAVALIKGELKAHQNQIEQLSIDGAGFNGEMLRTLEQELNVAVIVPPKEQAASKLFPSSEFKLMEDGSGVICPANEKSSYKERDRHGTIYRFKRSQCDNCPLIQQCVPKPRKGSFGRSVSKNDYEKEYQRARAKATTPEYAEIRREHPAIERKLNEVMNHHGGRRARYWGRAKVAAQQYMTGFTVNVKRMVKLLIEIRIEMA
jgi:transposase